MPPFDFQEQLLGRGGLGARLGAVAVQQVVLVRIDDVRETPARRARIARRVVGERQQRIAAHAPLGEKGDAARAVEALLDRRARRVQRFDAAGELAPRGRARGEAHHDPVARRRLEPGAQLLRLALVEAQLQGHGAGLGRRLELETRDALLADLEGRLALAGREQRVVVERLHLPPGAVGCADAERAERAGARRPAPGVEEPQHDHRPAAAVGEQRRSGAVELGTYRTAAIVHAARQTRDGHAGRVAHLGEQLVRAVAQVDAAPAADCSSPGPVGLGAIEVQRTDRRAVDRQHDALAGRVRDRDPQARDRRCRILGRRQEARVGGQRLQIRQRFRSVGRGVDRRTGRGAGRPVRCGTDRRVDRSAGLHVCRDAGPRDVLPLRRTARGDAEVDAPQRARPQVHELRMAAARMPRVARTVEHLQRLAGTRDVGLHHVCAGGNVLEVVAALAVRHGIAPILEIDRDALDARRAA